MTTGPGEISQRSKVYLFNTMASLGRLTLTIHGEDHQSGLHPAFPLRQNLYIRIFPPLPTREV